MILTTQEFDMKTPTAYHQLGKFIVSFQYVEATINDILILLAEADDDAVLILANELDYSARLKTADVLFARFVDMRDIIESSAKDDFHKLINVLHKLGERRNDFVHSNYSPWINVERNIGLIRENYKLRGKRGIRERLEEELLPETFSADLERINKSLADLESFRLRIIDWLYPDLQT